MRADGASAASLGRIEQRLRGLIGSLRSLVDDEVDPSWINAALDELGIRPSIVAHGATRFGTCAATDCDHLFYDVTRNRSRRFCADPRCASRTHTADHRARRRSG